MRDEFWVSQCEHCQGLEASIGADVLGVAAKSKLGPMCWIFQGFGSTVNPQFSFWKSKQPVSTHCMLLCISCLHAQGFHGSKVTLQLPRTKNSSHHTPKDIMVYVQPPLLLSKWVKWSLGEVLVAILQPTVQIACALWKLQPKPWVDAMGQTCHSLMSTHVDSLPEESFKHLRHAERCRFIFKRRIGWGRLWAGLVATYFESQRKAGPAASSASAGSLQIFFLLIWQNV